MSMVCEHVWQQIETIPEDGCDVLVFSGASGGDKCVHIQEAHHGLAKITGMSHWMPLPKAPK